MISFGPVSSRRLGKSLGINNIIPPKQCSYNCLYCQAGKTYIRDTARKKHYEPEQIFGEVYNHIKMLSRKDMPDYLTFVSNGEPTLDINLGKSVILLKKIGIPVAIITNASLLSDENVRNDVASADLVSLKVDAGEKGIWKKINRPSSELDFESYKNGLKKFSELFKGILQTETMVIKGINDNIKSFHSITEIVRSVGPSTAYLSIPTRPPAEESVKVPGQYDIETARYVFSGYGIETGLLTMPESNEPGSTGNIYEDILNITAVHPLREESLKELLEKDKADFSVVESLIRQKLIRRTKYKGTRYYSRAYHIVK